MIALILQESPPSLACPNRADLLSTAARNTRERSWPPAHESCDSHVIQRVPLRSESVDWRQASKAEPRREKRGSGNRDRGVEPPSLLVMVSGSLVRASSSCCWSGERDEEHLSL